MVNILAYFFDTDRTRLKFTKLNFEVLIEWSVVNFIDYSIS